MFVDLWILRTENCRFWLVFESTVLLSFDICILFLNGNVQNLSLTIELCWRWHRVSASTRFANKKWLHFHARHCHLHRCYAPFVVGLPTAIHRGGYTWFRRFVARKSMLFASRGRKFRTEAVDAILQLRCEDVSVSCREKSRFYAIRKENSRQLKRYIRVGNCVATTFCDLSREM